MKSVKVGAVLLSLWGGANLLLAVGILVSVVAFGRHPPSLTMALSAAEIAQLDAKALGLVYALAVLFNAVAAAFCVLVLVVVWTKLIAQERWAFWALAGSMVPLQAFGFVSDSYLGHRNVAANLGSTVVLLAGLALSRSATPSRSE